MPTSQRLLQNACGDKLDFYVGGQPNTRYCPKSNIGAPHKLVNRFDYRAASRGMLRRKEHPLDSHPPPSTMPLQESEGCLGLHRRNGEFTAACSWGCFLRESVQSGRSAAPTSGCFSQYSTCPEVASGHKKRREVGRYSHVCCLRQILTPNACRSYRHRVCLGLLCKSTQKSRIYQTFLLFLAINSPCRRCKPKHPSDSCSGIAAVLSPFLAPLSRFLPSCVQFRLLTRKIVSERQKRLFLIAKHFRFFECFFKNASEICEFGIKVVFARKFASFEPLFAIKNSLFVIISYFLPPPELLYWGYNVIVLGLQ